MRACVARKWALGVERKCGQNPAGFNSIQLLGIFPVAMNYRTWMCVVCGFIYDEAKGRPEDGIPPGTRWEDVPVNWTCPECGARKEDFEMLGI